MLTITPQAAVLWCIFFTILGFIFGFWLSAKGQENEIKDLQAKQKQDQEEIQRLTGEDNADWWKKEKEESCE